MGDVDRNSRRSKPQQQLYRPGSGPLRKSIGQSDEIEPNRSNYYQRSPLPSRPPVRNEIADITDAIKKISVKDASGKSDEPLQESRRNRKPDNAIYVPRPVAEAREEQKRLGSIQNVENPEDNFRRSSKKSFGKRKRLKRSSISERLSQERDFKTEANETLRERVDNVECHKSRNEDNSKFVEKHEERKEKEVKHDYKERFSHSNDEKHNNKPPFHQVRKGSGKSSTILSFSKFESLPPRFQRLYVEENGNRFSSDENWDANAITIHRQEPTRDYDNVVPRGRGRGRLRNTEQPKSIPERFARSLTPERFKDSLNPLRNENKAVSSEFIDKDHSRNNDHLRQYANSRSNDTLRNGDSSRSWDKPRNDRRYDRPPRSERNKSDSRSHRNETRNNDSFQDNSTKIEEKSIKIKEKTTEPVEKISKSDSPIKPEEKLPRRSSGKLYNPESNQLEDVKLTIATKTSEPLLDWADEVEMCEELDSLEEEPFVFTKPVVPPPSSGPPPLMKQQPFLHQPPPSLLHPTHHHQPTRSRRNRRRSGSRGRNSRRNSVDFGSNNPSRNNSLDRNSGWTDNNWRVRRDEERDNNSRHSSVDRNEAWGNSLERRGGRRRKSSERSNSGAGPPPSSGGGGRRRRSSERSAGGSRRRRSSERSNSSRAPENTNWRLEARPFDTQKLQHSNDQPKSISPNNRSASKKSDKEPSKPQGILFIPPSTESQTSPVNVPQHSPPQRQLYNPANPDKPIMVSPSRISAHEENSYTYLFSSYPPHFANNMGEQISAGRPLLYSNYQDMPKASNYRLVNSMELADSELQYLVSTAIFDEWDRIRSLRTFLKDSLKELLVKELKFCEAENVEQHFWRILYYNIIELLRKMMSEQPEHKQKCRELLINILDEGKEYYESLVSCLENTFNVKFDRVNPMVQELTGFPALSLISAQKMFLFLGDLARYKEQAFETSNYGQARQWYLKANQMNPKNGRPYNQLAILAFYTGRKIDAVYYYMRTLIASSPLASARESLVHIFDENRKKYEAEEKKKKEEKAARERERMREKEGSGGGLRREVWVHPGGRKNLHRTSTSSQPSHHYVSDVETLSSIPPAELNKRFSMCYLHVIGKIFTKIGLESLNETSTQMLREFRALMQHSPIQVKPTRFIQMMALNMFILEITQPKNEEVESCYRSTLQESALVISLEMFNIILERFIYLVGQDQPTDVSSLPPDSLQLLPPIKVWCDWLITHVEVWNPPPSSLDFSIGAGNCWEKLAILVNILERMTSSCDSVLQHVHNEDNEFILLPENATLAGYTPLMANCEEPVFTSIHTDMELAQNCLRVHRLIFFGTVFLCGLDPPVLKLHKMESGAFHYISIVETANSHEINEGEVFVESESESGVSEESEDSGKASGTEDEPSVPTQLKQLIETRQRLESLARKQMYKQSRKQRLLKEQEIVVEMEIRPKYLLPDTNCFIDYLELLSSIVKSHPHHPYIIMVPLVVVNELEGLSKVCKPGPSVTHAAHVREQARAALHLLNERQPALKPVTTKGHVLNSTAFICEEDTGPDMKNDDKILATCLNLCKINSKDDVTEDGKRKLYRNVVLLTEDRNLRLKALSKDVPVRELQDFVAWAGLG